MTCELNRPSLLNLSARTVRSFPNFLWRTHVMAALAAGQRITRWRSANGQTLLYNPQATPPELVDELRGVFGFNAKAAGGCLADIMISQQKGCFPPVAFMLISKMNRHLPVEDLVEKLQRAEKAFKHVTVVVVDRYIKQQELNLLHIKRQMKVRIVTALSYKSAAKLMIAIREKHVIELAEKAAQLTAQMDASLINRDHALGILHFNMPFLTQDECEMLLDMFGTISRLSQASAEEILDLTVLNADAAQAIDEFFHTEYVVE